MRKTPAATMVAAWISALTGRGAFHGIGQPDVQRNLAGFAGGTAEDEHARLPATTVRPKTVV